MFNIAYGKMHEYLAWKMISIFEIPLIMEFMDLWFTRKLKDAYLVLLFGKLMENLADKNEFGNLKILMEVLIV